MDGDQDLVAGRAAFEDRAWGDACARLAAAGDARDLGTADLERLGVAAHLSGHGELGAATFEQLHHRLLREGDVDGAARWAVWLAILLNLQGQHARAGGWFSRAQRVLDEAETDLAARGYLLVPVALRHLHGTHDPAAALEVFEQVRSVARRFDDPDLTALGLLGTAQSLVAMGDVDRGLPLLDEVMVTVTTSDVSPIMAGLAYCAVILACREVFDLRRAQEWTGVLSRWCDDQEGLRPYQGQCLVHRSEILQLHGDWSAAMAEIEHACDHLTTTPEDPVIGMARYQQGELLRLRGEFERAEDAYRQASEWGHTTLPGLALVWLAAGRTDEAAAALRGAVEDREGDRVRRAQVLGAYVEAMLVVGDVAAAATGVDELEEIADELDSSYLHAVATEGRGTLQLAQGDAQPALTTLRIAWRVWQSLDAPYESARVRLQLARACRELGDDATAALELDAARETFHHLGAAPALARVAALAGTTDQERPGGLTPRELEVLELVATGATNRQVAEALVISEKTVARHLSNMFTKLDIGSRAAATAWAYEHGVV